ncbi:MAG: amino acid carrier protein [Eubacteriales bacterium]
MDGLFVAINSIFSFVTPVSDWIWDFPTNYAWWQAIPILGNFTLAVILLMGTGLFFTFKLGFVQIKYFKKGVSIIAAKKAEGTGISPAASFFLSTAMRVGPGNITGVTGAILTGGPGALFWMWISAFFGMATAYVESVMAQIFKRKDGDDFVGGLPFYGRKLVKNSAIVGGFLSVLYILYALCCFPAQGYNTVMATASLATLITGQTFVANSLFNWVAAGVILVTICVVAFGGIKKVTRVTDKMVPIMAVVYCATVLVLIVVNFKQIPLFFSSVFAGAFTPQAIFGGTFGVALQQGIKRGLMSNEAGQGTITMPAAASNAAHPCEQGFVQSVGVCLDTMVICTLTGFVLIMGHLWVGDSSESFMNLDTLDAFIASAGALSYGGWTTTLVTILVNLCFGLFAYTCVVGFITFSEISAARISGKTAFIVAIRILCLVVIAFGMMSKMAGYDLSNLWAFSDLGNILIVYANIPLLYLGFKYVAKATAHYGKGQFTEEVVGLKLDYWKK